MDIPRKSASRKRRLRQILYAFIGLILVSGITIGVSRLKPAAPSVERATVWVDTVKRGEMLRQVRGLGLLVPEEIRSVSAVTTGRVERIVLRPGAIVRPDSILVELSNPDVEQAALEAESRLNAAKATLENTEVQLKSAYLNQEAQAAQVQAEYAQAKMQAETNEQLAKQGLIAELTSKLSKVRADELKNRNEIEQKRLAMTKESAKSQLAVQQATVDQLQTAYDLQRSRVEALKVRAGVEGVLQQLGTPTAPLEVGQQVQPGQSLARVAEPQRLKAELRIAETQAKDILIGQIASIDMRNGIIPGRVSRIDPAVQNGTVQVDVTLEGELPKGSRPDLSVDGTIELERLDNVIHVGRPAFGQEKSTITLFKLIEGGKEAVRTQVKLGRSSVNTIEIIEGLQPGEQVILSDTTAWDNYNHIRLN